MAAVVVATVTKTSSDGLSVINSNCQIQARACGICFEVNISDPKLRPHKRENAALLAGVGCFDTRTDKTECPFS